MKTKGDIETLRVEALAKFLDEKDLDRAQSLIDHEDYLVLTDDEADEKVREEILNSIWAFNSNFIASHSELDAETIRIIQDAKYEDANEPLKRLINDLDHFIEDAVSSDGRGHFLASYDGHENEEGQFYIYRRN